MCVILPNLGKNMILEFETVDQIQFEKTVREREQTLEPNLSASSLATLELALSASNLPLKPSTVLKFSSPPILFSLNQIPPKVNITNKKKTTHTSTSSIYIVNPKSPKLSSDIF